jgi:hypothetical protein
MSEIEPTTMNAFERFATNPAVVTIDLHRGHLDPEVATLPLNAESGASLLPNAATSRDLSEPWAPGDPRGHQLSEPRGDPA